FSVLNLILLGNDRNIGISDLLIAKVVQQKEWGTCVEQSNLVGRKQAEIQFRKDVDVLLANLQCK
ncbi:MAG TPA: hypothetical protein DCR64_07450, partial [Vibrio sp.]|nr:hypothetical protein [Vibrio sp.]